MVGPARARIDPGAWSLEETLGAAGPGAGSPARPARAAEAGPRLKAGSKVKAAAAPAPEEEAEPRGEGPALAGRRSSKPWWVVGVAPSGGRRGAGLARRGRGGKARAAGGARGGAAAERPAQPGQSFVGRAISGAPGTAPGRVVAFDQELKRWRVETCEGDLEGWLAWGELKPRLQAGRVFVGGRGAKRPAGEPEPLSLSPAAKKMKQRGGRGKRFSLREESGEDSPRPSSPLLQWSPEAPRAGSKGKFSPEPESPAEAGTGGERGFFLDTRQGAPGGGVATAGGPQPSPEKKKVFVDFDGLDSDVEDPPTPEMSATSEDSEEPPSGARAADEIAAPAEAPSPSGSVDQAPPKPPSEAQDAPRSSPLAGGEPLPEQDNLCSPVVQFSNEFSCEAAGARGSAEDGADRAQRSGDEGMPEALPRGASAAAAAVPCPAAAGEGVGDCAVQDQAHKVFDLDDFLGDVLEEPEFEDDSRADQGFAAGPTPAAAGDSNGPREVGVDLRLPSLSPHGGSPRLANNTAGRTPPKPSAGEEARGGVEELKPPLEQEESPTTPLGLGQQGAVKHAQHSRPASVPSSGARKRLLLSSVDREKMEKEVCTMMLNRKLIQHHEAGATWASCDVVGRPLDRHRVTELQGRFRKIEEEAETVFNNVEMERIRVKAGQDFERLKAMRSSAQPSRWQPVPRRLIVIAPRPPACKSILKSSKSRGEADSAQKKRVSFRLSSEGSGANSAAGEEEPADAEAEEVLSREVVPGELVPNGSPIPAADDSGAAGGGALLASLELGLSLT